MKRLFDFCCEMEFYFKVTLSCVTVQQFFYWIFHDIQLNYIDRVLLYWLVGSISFYVIGLFIEKVLKNNETFRKNKTARVKKVKPQPYPGFTAKGIALGELKTLIAALIILYLAPEVHRGNGLLVNMGWFFMRIAVADFLFYITHWVFHQKPFQKIHLKHHEFVDSSSFVAGHKTLAEYIIVTLTDIVPIFIFGYDITQLLAWTLIGNAYNLEGHSSLSLLFISSDFHDLHHTSFKGNYGIQGFWDRVFNTLNSPTKKTGLMFPSASLERQLSKLSTPCDSE